MQLQNLSWKYFHRRNAAILFSLIDYKLTAITAVEIIAIMQIMNANNCAKIRAIPFISMYISARERENWRRFNICFWFLSARKLNRTAVVPSYRKPVNWPSRDDNRSHSLPFFLFSSFPFLSRLFFFGRLDTLDVSRSAISHYRKNL